MNKTGKIIAIVLLSLLSLGLIGLLCVALTRPFDFNFNFGSFSGHSTNLALEKDYEFDGLKEIRLDARAADFIVRDTAEASTKAHLKIYDDKNEGTAELTDGILSIDMPERNCGSFFNGCHVPVVELTLPQDYAGIFDLESNAGDFTLGDFTEASLSINTNAGDIELGDMKKVEINSNAGDVEIKRVEILDINTDAGDIDIDDCFGKLNIEAHAGDIDINKLSLTQDSKIDTNAGDINIQNVGDVRVETDVNVGSQNVRHSNSDAEVLLRIKTNFGDVNVR